MSEETKQQYVAQLEEMFRRGCEWRKANPAKEALVRFNYPARTFVIAPISDAVKEGVVSTNEAGLELVKALWEWGGEYEPTVNMVRAVLEHEA